MKRLLRLIYRYLYHSFAFGYDFIASLVSAGSWYEWVKEISVFAQKDDRILEIGFGTGVLLTYFVERGFNVIGIDESKQMLKITKRRLARLIQSNILCRADIGAIPFQSGVFDLVISTFPSEYIFQKGFLKEIDRILVEKGRFIALIGVEFNRKTVIDWFFRALFRITNQNPEKSQTDESQSDAFRSKVVYTQVRKDERLLNFVTYIK